MFIVAPLGVELAFTPANDYRDKSHSLEYSVFDPQDNTGTYGKAVPNLQVSIGLYYRARVGLNLLELVDFLLGWTTLDILKDDIEAPP